ncbi:MAG TPA: tail fiber protein [Thermoanaerobaculia bacterium]|nr:tail fiber protein [Thermoanaerobaculia bacterium]
MSDPYIGEIRMFAGNFPPNGWSMANGALMPISQNDALFVLYGTTYGGDGQETFGIPNLNGRVPVHAGQGPGISQTYVQGEMAGVESVTLTVQQIPVHNHSFLGSEAIAQNPQPTDSIVAQSATVQLYITDAAATPMDNQAIQPVGGSQPHENMQPYLAIGFIVSLFGIFPPPQ